MNCDKCSKCMTTEDGRSFVGISVQTAGIEADFPKDFVQAQLGKYIIGQSYSVCYECALDMLMQIR